MADLVTTYVIENSPHAVAHPKLFKVTSVADVQVSKQEATFEEVSLANPTLFAEFLTQFKAYIIAFGEGIDDTAGIDALKQEILRSFEKGIMYAYNNARSVED